MFPLRNLTRFLQKAAAQPLYALCVLAKRLRAQAYYALGNGVSPAPESITLFMTRRCNLQCRMCGQWGEAGVARHAMAKDAREDLPWDLFKRVIDEAAFFNPSQKSPGFSPRDECNCASSAQEEAPGFSQGASLLRLLFSGENRFCIRTASR